MTSPNPASDKAVINWLLEKDDPSVRYFTLRDLLDRDDSDSDLKAAKAAIPRSKTVSKIFAKQKPGGHWEEPWSPYLPKYKSSYWQIMILGQLGLDKDDLRVCKACEHVFPFQTDDGAFSSHTTISALKKYQSLREKGEKLSSLDEWAAALVFEHQYSCLTGNMAAALIRLGYFDDPRLQKALKWLMKVQNRDGGWLCPYWRAHVKDSHGCFYGTICPLEALSEVPKQFLSKQMKTTIERGAEFLLMHRLFKADHHNYAIINRSWLKLGFPFYGYNILRGLDVISRLGYVEDERLGDAVEVLSGKRCPDGRWMLENAPTGRMHVNLEAVGKPSKWITLIALRVLKRLNQGVFTLSP
jgi:hypothetical protein